MPRDQWWRSLDSSLVDPITLEPLCQLKVPPSSTDSVRTPLLHMPSLLAQNTRVCVFLGYRFTLESRFQFDGEALAAYMVASGSFVNPITRAPLGAEECSALGEHLEARGSAQQSLSVPRRRTIRRRLCFFLIFHSRCAVLCGTRALTKDNRASRRGVCVDTGTVCAGSAWRASTRADSRASPRAARNRLARARRGTLRFAGGGERGSGRGRRRARRDDARGRGDGAALALSAAVGIGECGTGSGGVVFGDASRRRQAPQRRARCACAVRSPRRSLSVTRSSPARFGLLRVQTTRTVRGFPERSQPSSPDARLNHSKKEGATAASETNSSQTVARSLQQTRGVCARLG